jgi:hypothetical protein
MRFSIAVILAIAFPLLVLAGVSTVKVPGQDWEFHPGRRPMVAAGSLPHSLLDSPWLR